MRRSIHSLFIFSSFVFGQLNLFSQDLEKIGKKDMLKVSGGLNTTSIFSDTKGTVNQRQAFTYLVHGNITGNIIGINLPFTFNYNNNQVNYSQPGNLQSFNPSYKWAKGYFGITSLNFSQYTQSNHLFSGAGIELSPGGFRVLFIYGTFKKAKGFDFENNSDVNMSFKRTGLGTSIGYEKNGSSLKFIYFSAKDDVKSLPLLTSNLKPMGNTVISVIGKRVLFKKLNLEGEWALSGLTRNTALSVDGVRSTKNYLPVLFSTDSTLEFFQALRSSLTYKLNSSVIAINYERVDPDYVTLGTYFINNDLETITFAPTFNFLNGKLNLNLKTGLQRNDLKNQKVNSTKRLAGSINCAYTLSKDLSVNGSFSNFSSITKQKPQSDPFYKTILDTLNFYQVAQNGSGAVTYRFDAFSVKQNLALNCNYLVTSQNQSASTEFLRATKVDSECKSFNTNLVYGIMHPPTKTTISTGFNSNSTTVANQRSNYFGPSFNVSTSLLNQNVKMNLGVTYNQVFQSRLKTGEIISNRFSAAYSPKMKNEKAGKFSFNLSACYVAKISGGSPDQVAQFMCNTMIMYSF